MRPPAGTPSPASARRLRRSSCPTSSRRWANELWHLVAGGVRSCEEARGVRMGTMTLYPAIDLLGGRSLHIGQGADEKTFEGDPVEVAQHWRDAGATWLHVVDLDGALAGEPKHLDTLQAIAEAVKLPIQVGGG